MKWKSMLRRTGATVMVALIATAGLVAILRPTVVVRSPKLRTVAATTRTPIQHVVVIFQENESFDHYFGTYPVATNPAGESPFTALPGTPSVNGLVADSLNGNANLLASNPNGANPQRLDPGPNASGAYNTSLDSNGSNAGIDNVLTCSQNHNYQPEQQAFDGGLIDKFPGSVGKVAAAPETGEPACVANTDLDYYDGNTVTAYWNYAQHYAMSDNSFGTTFGPSTPGAINVISGDTGNFNLSNNAAVTPGATTATNTSLVADGDGGFSDINDGDPYYDDCSSITSNIGINNVSSTGITDPNVGDLLNEAGVSWGWFQGGFTPTTAATGATDTGYAGGPAAQSGKAVCGATHNIGAALGGTGAGAQPYGTTADYVQHHEPFQYYASTANPRHILPTSLSAIGTDTQSFTGGSYGVGTPEFNTANHQYDMSYFDQLVSAITAGTMPASSLPAVSYLKAPAYEDEHPSNSDPVDGQHFVTTEIDNLMATPDWSSTAVIVAYDDSDGWYDSVFAGNENGATSVQNQSSAGGSPSEGDAENPAVCGGTTITGSTALSSVVITTGVNDTITYTVGGGSAQSLTIPAKTYTAATLATAISTASNGVITAEASATNHLILTDNGLLALKVTAGDGLASVGLSAGQASVPASPVLTNTAGQPENGRCGFGPRLPFMVISPYAKANYVDHTLADQASVVNFIEYNWSLGTIPGSAAQLLTNPANTFDLKNMFDFSSGATDIAGATPYILNTTTFEPANPTITWGSSTMTYGTALSSTQLNASSATPGTFSYSQPAGTVLGVGAHTLTASFTPTTLSASNSGTATATVTVTAAPLVVTGPSLSYPAGVAPPTLTPSYTGFAGGDSASSLTTAPTCFTTASRNSPPGTYLSVCPGAVDGNYAITYAAGTVTLTGSKAGFASSKGTVSGTKVQIPLSCSVIGTSSCSGRVTLSVARATKHKGVFTHLVLAKGTVSLSAGQRKTVSVKLTAAGMALLAKVSAKAPFRASVVTVANTRAVRILKLT